MAERFYQQEIRRRMAQKGLSQRALGKLAKLGSSGIKQILNGESEWPRLVTFMQIADALECHFVELLVPADELADLKSRNDLPSIYSAKAAQLAHVMPSGIAEKWMQEGERLLSGQAAKDEPPRVTSKKAGAA